MRRFTRSILTREDFTKFSTEFQKNNQMPYAFGIGLVFHDKDGNTLAHKWLSLNIEENFGSASALLNTFGDETLKPHSSFYRKINGGQANNIIQDYFLPFERDGNNHENVQALLMIRKSKINRVMGCVIVYQTKEVFETAITSNGDAHFRLAAVSRLKFQPNTICLDNIFSVLPNVVWAGDDEVYTVEEWNQKYWFETRTKVLIDKIPLLTWGAPVPVGVRIANPDNVRLGAYLSPGTTVMHYGFVNFNAGTLGKSMVEGRISAGTTIGDGTDVGAGAGFLGTLSGGNSLKLSAGKDCLIGANAECGVILGNNCVVATGTCFSQNTPILEVLPGKKMSMRKVSYFNGKDNLTFRRNAITGQLEVIQKGNKAILNDDLHTGQ